MSDDPAFLDFEKPARKKARRVGKMPGDEVVPLRERIPMLPDLGVDPSRITTSDQRSVACVNMRLAGAPFHEIANELGYRTATSARQAYIAALAHSYPVEDWETLRQVEAMRAEALLRRSLAMASADYLVDHETGEKIPNSDRIRWHEQAGKDLALHATITGAKAPTRVEVSATTQELNQMVNALMQAQGEANEIEAGIWDAEEIPDAPEEEP